MRFPAAASLRIAWPSKSCARLVEAVKGFVEQKNVGLLRERPSEKCSLLLSAGERADLALAQIGEIHRAQSAFNSAGVGTSKTAPIADPHVTTHLDHAAHRDWKIPVNHTALWEIGNVGVRANFSVTAENDLAGFFWHKADQRFEKCCLTRAVRSEQRDTMTAMQVEANVVHRWHPMICHRQILYFQMMSRHRVGFGLRLREGEHAADLCGAPKYFRASYRHYPASRRV